MSNQPNRDSLRQQLARPDQKRAAFAGLPAPAVESLFGSLRLELTSASNAIEGNTLSLPETQLVVEEGLAPGQGRTLREVYEARNHFTAIKEVECDAAPPALGQALKDGRLGITARAVRGRTDG